MNISQITEIIGWLFGAGGVLTFFMYRKANAKAKDAEADKIAAEARLASAQADKGVIDNYEMFITRLEKTIEQQDKRFAQSEEFHEKRYIDLKTQLETNTEKLKELSKKIDTDKQFMCYDLECKIRRKKNA